MSKDQWKRLFAGKKAVECFRIIGQHLTPEDRRRVKDRAAHLEVPLTENWRAMEAALGEVEMDAESARLLEKMLGIRPGGETS